jgi:hypothetical protein
VLDSVCTTLYHVKKNACVMPGKEDECLCYAKKVCGNKLRVSTKVLHFFYCCTVHVAIIAVLFQLMHIYTL